MNSAKNAVIALLVLTTIGGAALAWKQYQELVSLRASAMSEKGRADLEKRIADLQKANRSLEDELAAARNRGDQEEDVMAADRPAPDANGGQRGGRGQRGQQFAAMRDLMAKPEVQALISSAQKAGIESRYAALLKNLNLSTDQKAKLEQLLADRQNTRQDVMTAAREQGLDPRADRDAIQKLISDAQNSINDNIKSVIGDSGFNQLQTFDQTMPQRNLVNTLQQRLSFTDSPLTAAQSEQLVQILAATTPARTTAAGAAGADQGGGGFGRGGDFGPGGFGGRMGALMGEGGGGGMAGLGGPTITPDAVTQAQTVLNATQLTALQQIQQQQQNAQQLRQLMRSTFQNGNGTATQGGNQAGTATGTGTGTGSGGGRRRGGG